MGNINNRNKLRNYILVFLTFIVCIGVASMGYAYNFLQQLSSKKNGGDSVKPISASRNDPVNILVMGVDMGTLGVENSKNPRRTDTILLMNYNPKLQEVNVISIPRDTLIAMNDKYKKINEAHAIGGPAYLIDAVQKLLDIRVNYYGKVDYSGFRKIIDTIGPIEVKINNRMDYDDNAQNLHIHFNKGEVVKLDGEKAEEFFRWRKNNDGTGLSDGDLGRIENQQLFISKVVDKFKNPAIIPKIPSILSTIPNYAVTNMSAEDIIKYGYMLSKIDKSNIKFSTIKGDAEYISGISYLVYDEKKNKDILMSLHNETTLNK